jgi:hypothetical protein
MNIILKEWTERIAMVLEFLSFWFAAPELLGKAILKEWENRLKSGIAAIPKIFVYIATIVWILLWLFTVLCVLRYADLNLPRESGKRWVDEHWLASRALFGGVTGGFFLALYFLRARVRRFAVEKVVKPLLHKFADDSRARQRALALGAALFVTAFILKFIISFVHSERPL